MALHQVQEHLGSDLHARLCRYLVGILRTDVPRNPRNPELGSVAGRPGDYFRSTVNRLDVETTRLLRTQTATVVRVCLIGRAAVTGKER